MASFWLTLAATAAAVVALLLAAFLIALRIGRYNVVDVFWGLGFALIAGVAFAASAGHGDPVRRVALLTATVIWGVRLAAYIGWRSRGAGEDPRYADMLAQATGSRPAFALRKIFLLQAGLIWLISAPVPAWQLCTMGDRSTRQWPLRQRRVWSWGPVAVISIRVFSSM